MRYKTIFFLFIYLLSNFNFVSAQSIYDLIGDTIIIPEPFPKEFKIYYKSESSKQSFKNKNLFKGKITNTPIIIQNVKHVNRGGEIILPKDYALVDIKTPLQQFVIKIPLVYKEKESNPATSEILGRYWPKYNSFYFEGLGYPFTMPYIYECNLSNMIIPHYKVSDINLLKKDIKGKTYINKKSPETIIIKDLIEEKDKLYSVIFEDSHKQAHVVSLKYNTAIKEEGYFSIQYLKENFYDKDSLISELELNPKYKRINKLRDSLINRSFHINNINKFYIIDSKTNERVRLSDNKFYLIKDILIMRNPENSKTEFNYYTLIQELNDTRRMYAFQFNEYDFQDNIVDANLYIEQKNKRLKKEQELLIKQQKEKKEKARRLSEQRRQYKENLIINYGEENAQLILKGKIRLGFSKQMVRASWGSPWDTTRVTNKFGTTECWIYNYDTSVLFENGVVVQIIN